jgi:hypothetical protein
MRLPDVVEVRQTFPRPRVEDVSRAVAEQWERDGIGSSVRPGMEVAIGVGSRGIAEIPSLVRAVARCVREAGASPFIVPAMGSHGGATAEGQREVLARLGVTEAAMGCPVVSDMTTDEIGRTADGIAARIGQARRRGARSSERKQRRCGQDRPQDHHAPAQCDPASFGCEREGG